MTAPRPLRVIAVADSDSYIKWGAAVLDRMPRDWERELIVLATPLKPSAAQLAAAVHGVSVGDVRVLELADLADHLRDRHPDVVLLALRGPTVRVVLREAAALDPRPVFVGGLPGISIPATRKAVAYRTQLDLFLLHSRREVREFTTLAAEMDVPQRFALAGLPFLPDRPDPDRDQGSGAFVFAAQAKVPKERDDRVLLLRWLAEAARAHPEREVVIKVRALAGEAQTHFEQFDFAQLLTELDTPAPTNLVVRGGSMAAQLATAAGLVTVSSTAAIEAVSLGVPTLTLVDFGISPELINTVFEGSGLGGTRADLVAGRFRHPDPAWLDDNYFHGVTADDWVEAIAELAAAREAGTLPLKPQLFGTSGGALRRAWDRKKSLGSYDRSASGTFAYLLGTPLFRAQRAVKRLRRALRGGADPELAQADPGAALTAQKSG